MTQHSRPIYNYYDYRSVFLADDSVVESKMYSESDILPIAILIASQRPVFCQHLRITLSQQRDFNIIDTWRPAEEASRRFHQTGWTATEQDLMLVLDISAPLSRAVQLLADWHSQQPESKALIVSDTLTEGFILEALRYGARGFMLRTCPLGTYAKAIRVIHSGDLWIGRKMLVHLLQTVCQADTYLLQGAPDHDKATASTYENWDWFAQPAPEDNVQQANNLESSLILRGQEYLTNREQEIVHYVAQGLSNKEIAKHISISDKTVKTHLHTIFSKLKIRRRMDLVLPRANHHYY